MNSTLIRHGFNPGEELTDTAWIALLEPDAGTPRSLPGVPGCWKGAGGACPWGQDAST